MEAAAAAAWAAAAAVAAAVAAAAADAGSGAVMAHHADRVAALVLLKERMMAPVRHLFVVPLAAALLASAFLPARALAADPVAHKHFPTPEAAAEALVAAGKAHDQAALLALIGSDAKEAIASGDPVADREGADRFIAAYTEKHSLEKIDDSAMELQVGEDDFPLPIPIVKDEHGWYLDGKEGVEEIVARRIGRNELFVIQACLAYVDAQREYYEKNPEKTPLLHFARRVISTPGKRDGLYYPTKEDEEASPLGEGFERATAAGYKPGQGGAPIPFHGYYFKILEGQGPKAPGGAYSYVVHDQMLGGFALIAWPAQYGVSGVMTFLVNHDGDVYQKDFGKDTATKAKAVTLFDLDDKTTKVAEEDEEEIEAAAITPD
jgi:hypothetical protein